MSGSGRPRTCGVRRVGGGASGSGREDTWDTGGAGSSGDQAQIRPEELMDTITARITERLREEFKLEAQREGGESQLSQGGREQRLLEMGEAERKRLVLVLQAAGRQLGRVL